MSKDKIQFTLVLLVCFFSWGCKTNPGPKDVADFYTAIENADVSTVKRYLSEYRNIIDYYNSPDLFNQYVYPPAVSAVSSGNIEMLSTLYEAGASLNARMEPYGYTPIHVAISTDNSEIVQWLINHGADVYYTRDFNKNIFHTFAAYSRNPHIFSIIEPFAPFLINQMDDLGFSPLEILVHAIIDNDETSIPDNLSSYLLFIDNQADVSRIFEEKTIAYFYWLIANQQNDYVIPVLNDFAGSIPCYQGESALEIAIAYGNYDIIPYLVPYVDLQHRGEDGNSVLVYAVKYDAPCEVFKLLVEAGADKTMTTHNGKTARELYKEITKVQDPRIVELLSY